MPTFRSMNASLFLGFDPKKFGLLFDPLSEQTDMEGRTQYGLDGKPVPRKLLKQIQFRNGVFSTEDPDNAPILERYSHNAAGPNGAAMDPVDLIVKDMRKHPGNRDNGGADFFESNESDESVAHALHGFLSVTLPSGGLTELDRTMLLALEKQSGNKPISSQPDEIVKIRDTARDVMARFKVKGIILPASDKKVTLLKSKIVELMDLFEQQGIWPEKEEAA